MKVGDLVLDIGTRECVLIIGERPCYQGKSGRTHTWDFEVLYSGRWDTYYADKNELEAINENW